MEFAVHQNKRKENINHSLRDTAHPLKENYPNITDSHKTYKIGGLKETKEKIEIRN